MECVALHGPDWQPTVSQVAALLNVNVSSIKGKEAVSLGVICRRVKVKTATLITWSHFNPPLFVASLVPIRLGIFSLKSQHSAKVGNVQHMAIEMM